MDTTPPEWEATESRATGPKGGRFASDRRSTKEIAMKEISRPTLAAKVFLLIGVPAYGKDPILLQPSQFDARTILHSPPANDSAQTKAELAALHQIETTRTPARLGA